MGDFIQELKWRGMIQDITPGAEEMLGEGVVSAYIGFDPTAPSLHIGNLATLMLLKFFQMAGHRPVALVGGATGMIGDPSGKSEERNLLDEETLRKNEEAVRNQLAKFLDFDSGDNSAILLNNYDWFKDIGFLEFLRDAGKHLTVNYMTAKDSVKSRLETGISFTEFSYQLLQGYDYLHLFQNHGVKLQMGGSDQWGNIITGTELIRRKTGEDAHALTTPLITKADGSKFGKTESGNVWLDPEMTSPYHFYQFWLNVSDEDAVKIVKVFTLKGEQEIDTLIAEHQEAPHARVLQNALAQEVTARVHSTEELEKAVQATNILFGRATTDELRQLDEDLLLAVFEGVPQPSIGKGQLNEARDVTELLSTTTGGEIFPSKGEARRMISGGGVSINKVKLTSPEQEIDFDLLQEKYLLVQKGKKNYFLVKVET